MEALLVLLILLMLALPIITLASLLVLRARLNERLARIEDRLHALAWPDRTDAEAQPPQAAAPAAAPNLDPGAAFAWPEAPAPTPAPQSSGPPHEIRLGDEPDEAPGPRESL